MSRHDARCQEHLLADLRGRDAHPGAAAAEAERLGVAVCLAVADSGGHPLAFGRMDGAPLMSARIAQDKAYTVAAFNGLPTHRWYDMIADERPCCTASCTPNGW